MFGNVKIETALADFVCRERQYKAFTSAMFRSDSFDLIYSVWRYFGPTKKIKQT